MTLLIGILLAYTTVSVAAALVVGRLLHHGEQLASGALSTREPAPIETARPAVEEKRAA